MPTTTTLRRLAALAVCFLLLLPAGPGWAHHADPPGPIHAGNTFGWYPVAKRYEFHGTLGRIWKKRGRGVVHNKNGMLTLESRVRGNLSATLKGRGHATGRWEIRWRARSARGAYKNFTVRTELIPAGHRKQYCGARNIALESYTMGQRKARFYIRALPDLAFRAAKRGRFAKDRWHTFAVEVTRKRIVWFVDAHVVSTERRRAALSGVPLTVRFSLVSVPGARMNRARMQMDWLRYWTLRKPDSKSVRAPAPHRGTYRKACPPA